jgi:uncharacterized membrane protein
MHESIGISALDSVYFDKQIFPIIQNNCTASDCHNGRGEAFPLTSYAEIVKHVSPGNSNSSELYKVITASYINPMPPDKPLTATQRSLIKVWIDQGAKNNIAPATDTSDTSTNTNDSIFYNPTIAAIINNNCTASGCHNGTSVFSLKGYTDVMKYVTAGNFSQCQLYTVLASRMPPGSPLSAVNQQLIKKWIEQGAKYKNDSTSAPVDTTSNDTTIVIEKYKACFSKDILPILTANCATSGCHDASSAREGIILSNYSGTMQIVSAGNVQGSLLYNIISRTDEDRMPPLPRSALSKTNIDSIAAWISYGALNQTCQDNCDTTKFTFATIVNPIISNNCSSCHNDNYKSGSISLSNYTNIAAIAQNGKLVGTITHSSGYPLMPQGNKMNDCNIIKIQKWVKSGYPNN